MGISTIHAELTQIVAEVLTVGSFVPPEETSARCTQAVIEVLRSVADDEGALTTQIVAEAITQADGDARVSQCIMEVLRSSAGVAAIWQQYIILSGVSGSFDDDEVLDPSDDETCEMKTRATALGGADQISVGCDTGIPPTPPGGDRRVQNPSDVPPGGDDIIYETDGDLSALMFDAPTIITGETSAATGYFIGWETIEGRPHIVLRGVVPGAKGLSFLPNERLIFDGRPDITDARIASQTGQGRFGA